MEDLGTLVLSLPRIPPPLRIETFHGGLMAHSHCTGPGTGPEPGPGWAQ